MGAFISIFRGLFGVCEIKLLMVGLLFAGKTTILNVLRIGEIVTLTPTTGFDVETVRFRNIRIISFDAGVNDTFRHFWKQYYQNVDGIIFVVDSHARYKIPEAKEQLTFLLNEDDLKDALLLILSNKQDLADAMSYGEVTKELHLHSLRNRNWHNQPTTALSGDGLTEGIGWLTAMLDSKHLQQCD